MIGKIQRVDIRNVWAHEAHDFTRWLADNIDVLNEVIAPILTIVDRESNAGDFKLDLLAEDEQGRPVVIENQLGRSDHDHLGKLLTYLAAFDAKIAVWIVGQPRAEHVSAITWLNESSSADFYLVKAEAITIADSAPALLLTEIVGPGEESKSVAIEKEQLSERHQLRHEFWSELLAAARERTPLHENTSPSDQNWISASAGISGLGFNYVIGKDWWRIELYIDRGKDSKEQNESLFDSLVSQQVQIEESFGSQLNWERLDAKRACRISYARDGVGYRSSREEWPIAHEAMISAMIRFERSLRDPLRRSLGASPPSNPVPEFQSIPVASPKA